MNRKIHFALLLIAAMLTACADNYKYKIGVSQCVGGRWREKANNEMLSAQHLYDNDVKVVVKNADNDSRRQCRQIDSLADAGIDLLVVSPNDYKTLYKSLRRVREKKSAPRARKEHSDSLLRPHHLHERLHRLHRRRQR